MSIADRMRLIPVSPIAVVSERIRGLQARGRDIIDLTVGRPDFGPGPAVVRAMIRALQEEDVHYTSGGGIPALRQAVAAKLREDNGLATRPEDVLITAGVGEAVFLAFAALLNPGDEVLIPEPAWPQYRCVAGILGARPVSVPLAQRAEQLFDTDAIERAITPRTRLLVVNTPHNPTGTCAPPRVLAEIAALVRRSGLWVLSDEIYEALVYGKPGHVSLASFPGVSERVITLGGFSKAFGMDGLRLGYLAAPEELLSAALRVHQYTIACAPSVVQTGGVVALHHRRGTLDTVRALMRERRDLLRSALARIPGITSYPLQGAFYGFLNVGGLGLDGQRVSELLLEEAGVATVPGVAFGERGSSWVRLSYAVPTARLAEALERIERLLTNAQGSGRKGRESPARVENDS